MAKLENWTPHEITLFLADGVTKKVIPSSGIARVKQTNFVLGPLAVDEGDIPLVHSEFGAVEGLPCPMPGTMYIVSSLVASAAKDRDDLLVPTGFVRDEGGNILGCTGLQTNF